MPLNRRGFLAAGALATPLAAAGATATATAAASEQRSPGGGDPVLPGADLLAARGWRDLAGRKVGVLSNPTGVLADRTHIVDSMVAADHAPVAVFGPEHGFRGSAQAGDSQGDYVDPRTGIPVYDAYAVSIDKLAAMFRKAGVDTVVFDIADVGARFYTYIWSMYTAMAAASRVGASFQVLDRPNPIGGRAFGPMLDPAFASGVGRKPIVQQHGMTVGELAKLFDAKFLPDDGGRLAELTVVETRGWRRTQLYESTGLSWTPPSPNMPTENTALAYPGTCMFEGTVLSEGRGTTRPFETIGAPGIDWHWAEELTALELPGVLFRETYYVPTFGKFVDETCCGVTLSITDPHSFEAIRTAVAMIVTAKRRYPEVFAWRPDNYIDKLTGSARLRTMVDAGASSAEIVDSWRAELAEFRREREPYLLYR